MNSEVQNNENKEKGDGKKKVLIAIVALVLAVLIIAVVGMAALLVSTNKKMEEQAELAASEPEVKLKEVIMKENVEDVLDDFLGASIPQGVPTHYTVTQNSDWEFPNGTAVSPNAYVSNVAENETPVYFDLIVDETGEIVYSSPVIALGAELTEIKLDKPLDAGTYICTCEYHLVDDNQNTLTTVNVGVTVIVLE